MFDSPSPPGDTLGDLLDERAMTQAELADRTGLSRKTVNEIVGGKAPITPETALALERVFGLPSAFWTTRESQYRDALARQAEIAAVPREWQAQFPVAAMVGAGFLDAPGRAVADRTRALMDFFGVASPAAFDRVWMNPAGAAAFRRSLATATKPHATAAWLRAGEIEAARRQGVAPYSRDVLLAELDGFRALTREAPETFESRLIDGFARAGVVFVLTPEVTGAPICGATRWLTADRALVQVSLRYKTNDHFWFTVFHEAGHVALHGKRDVFLEKCGGEDDAVKEAEADRFAQDRLVPRAAWDAFVAAGWFGGVDVQTFADAQGIAPGIVVGRLQREQHLTYRDLNHMKQRFEWIRDES